MLPVFIFSIHIFIIFFFTEAYYTRKKTIFLSQTIFGKTVFTTKFVFLAYYTKKKVIFLTKTIFFSIAFDVKINFYVNWSQKQNAFAFFIFLYNMGLIVTAQKSVLKNELLDWSIPISSSFPCRHFCQIGFPVQSRFFFKSNSAGCPGSSQC